MKIHVERYYAKIIADSLRIYLSYDDSDIQFLLDNPNFVDKQRIETIDNLEVIIYPNDHIPPHFHVKSKDLNIDAKFLIETGELYTGKINSRDLKKIQAFYQSPKGKNWMKIVWEKYHH